MIRLPLLPRRMLRRAGARVRTLGQTLPLLLLLAAHAGAQQAAAAPQQEIQRIAAAIAQAQAQIDQSQKDLSDLRRSLAALEQHLGTAAPSEDASSSAQELAGARDQPAAQTSEQRTEHEAVQDSELATLNQAKVESSSKYPVTLRGLVLLNGFVNTGGVDIPAGPAVALGGPGSTGASLRQTSIGIDARGPTLGGGQSHADFTMDFLGSSSQGVNADVPGLLRLRTAHAILDWQHTAAFVEFDRPILSPNAPTSLVAVAEPALAWSGNLWQWTPQAGISHDVSLGSHLLAISAALIDVPDPPALAYTTSGNASLAEGSRWPGTELHIGLANGKTPTDGALGVGGYFSPHRRAGLPNYDAWATTLDFRTPQWAGLQLTGSVYRGLALGGLGAGAYKDVVSRQQGTSLLIRPLDDVGGWAQLKRRAGERLEFNAALGLDQAFAKELRAFPTSNSALYADLARNRTLVGNTIWSPSAYLVFSFEYRRIASFSTGAPAANSNIFGAAAGYRF